MILQNYSFGDDDISILIDGKYIDIHNCYEFYELIYNTKNREVVLKWKVDEPDEEDFFIDDGLPRFISMFFEGVHFLKSIERDHEMPFSEDDCVETFGFLLDKLIDQMKGLSSNNPQSGCSHFIVNFMSGFAIKLSAKTSSVKYGENAY